MKSLILNYLVIVSATFAFTAAVFAQQNITVTGTVRDNFGTMSGVNVVVKGTAIETKTNDDGAYRITAPDTDAILVFSLAGYNSVERTVGSLREINVVLEMLGIAAVNRSNADSRSNAVRRSNAGNRSSTVRRSATVGHSNFNSKFYMGLVGGIGLSNDINIGLNAAYFLNRYIGVGFAARSFGYEERDNYTYYSYQMHTWKYYSRDTKVRNIFVGPVFYGHLLQTRNGKFFLSTCVGLGGIHHYYVYDENNSLIHYSDDNKTSIGYFLSGGFGYRPINWFSIGLNCEHSNRFSIQHYDGRSFETYYDIGPFFNFGINFHF